MRRVLGGWAASDTASVVGSRVTSVALPWFVLTTTGSAVQTGLVAAVQLAPMVVCKALSGPVLDRVGPARAGVRLDLASAVVAAAVPALHAAGLLGFPLLLVVVAVLGSLRGPADAAKGALVPDVARASGQPLERVTGIAGTIERLATTVGVAAAGLLVAAVGAPAAVLVTAAGFALSALLVGTVVGPAVTTSRPDAEDGGYLHRLAGGWAHLRTEPVLLAIVAMVSATNLLDQAWVVVLVPLWARAHGYGAGTVGLVLGTMTGAAVAGSLAATAVGHRLPRLPLYVAAYLLAGLPRFLVLALDAGLPAVLAVMAVGGVASGVLNPVIGAVLFERIPDRLVGRVTALVTAASWSLMPFGGLLGGALSDGLGLAPALVACGTAYLLLTLAPLAVPSFRAMGHRTPSDPHPAG